MNLADRYCRKCVNYEICQSTGCSDRQDLLELEEKSTPKQVMSIKEHVYLSGVCPTCNYVNWENRSPDTCFKCGQKLKW